MAGVAIRNFGGTATMAPVIKRGVATFSDGRTVSLVIDQNQSAAGGQDITNVAKIVLYVSTNSDRTAHVSAANLTPAVAPCSTTRPGIASLAVASDNSVWVAWSGVDNGLYITKWTYSAGTLTFVATTTVVAAGAITNRFRSIDLDVAGTANPIIGTYEANASSGEQAYHRAYVLKADGVTWIRAFQSQILVAGQFIRAGSEDVSISWRGDGIVSNVGRFLFYGTKTAVSVDIGDFLRDYSINISTASTDGATNIGTYYSTLNVNQAAGTRRAMIFTLSNTVFLFAGVIGSSVPKFFATKLTTGVFTTPVYTTAGFVSTVALANFFKIDQSANARTAWTCSYSNNRLMFAFAGPSSGATPRLLREIVFQYTNLAATTAKPTVDSVPRPLDSSFFGTGGPIAVYGGTNRLHGGARQYNFLTLYGPSGNAYNLSALRSFRFVAEDLYDPPVLVSPISTSERTNRPVFRVRVDNANLSPNLYGKIEIQLSTSTTFLSNIRYITEDDSKFQYFGNKDGLAATGKQVTLYATTATALFGGGTNWFWRARVLDDKGGVGAWSAYQVFFISHPPVAVPVEPKSNQVVTVTNPSNHVRFAWKFSDTDPLDSHNAYQLLVFRTDIGAQIFDSGIQSAIDPEAVAAIAPTDWEFPLEWQVRVRDQDLSFGPYSERVAFKVGDYPFPTLTAPLVGAVVNTAAPTVTWTFTGFGGRTQAAYRVTLWTYVSFDRDELVADSGWRAGASTTYTFPTNVLETGNPYIVYVEVKDTGGLRWEDYNDFTTDWTEPALASATLTQDKFKVRIAWTNATMDADFVAWRVYRRYMKPAALEIDILDTAHRWELIYETTDSLSAYQYDDYTCPLNRTVDYVVVQLAERFGSFLESNITSYFTTTQVSDRFYFVPEVPIGTIASFEGADVVGDQFVREVEQETLHVIGRGRQVQIGDDLGYIGSLTIHLRNPSTARLNREFLEAVSAQYNRVYIKSPFGDVFLVALGNVQTSRQAGYGQADIGDLVVPYSQIIDAEPVYRVEP